MLDGGERSRKNGEIDEGKSCPQSCSESRVPEHHLEHELLQGLSAPFPSCQFSQTQETQRTVMCTPRAQLMNSRHETSKWAWSCTHHKSNSLVLNLPWSLHIWNCPNSRILEIKRCERETTPTCLTLWHTMAPMFYGMFSLQALPQMCTLAGVVTDCQAVHTNWNVAKFSKKVKAHLWLLSLSEITWTQIYSEMAKNISTGNCSAMPLGHS